MVGREALIKLLDPLLERCSNSVQNLIVFQKLAQNDVRVTFFKHLITTHDATIISLLVSHKYFGEESWWRDIQQEYDLSARNIPYDREFDYADQITTISYFLFTFSSFEHSLRLICKTYNPSLYQSQKDFNPLCKALLKKSGIAKKDVFIDLIGTIRNTVHTNGLYVPRGNTKNKRIVWKNQIFDFNENKPIKFSNLWTSWISISAEIFDIFTELINFPDIKKIRYFKDPSESAR